MSSGVRFVRIRGHVVPLRGNSPAKEGEGKALRLEQKAFKNSRKNESSVDKAFRISSMAYVFGTLGSVLGAAATGKVKVAAALGVIGSGVGAAIGKNSVNGKNYQKELKKLVPKFKRVGNKGGY